MITRTLPGLRDLLPAAAASPATYPCLLESVATGTPQSRWDLLLAFPQQSLHLHADGRVRDGQGVDRGANFLAALDHAWRATRIARTNDALPFHGGWALYLGYELAGEIEPSLHLPAGPEAYTPLAMALYCPAAILRDHERCETVLVAEAGHEDLLDCMQADLASSWQPEPLARPRSVREESAQQFLDGVARVHEYLRRGDVFQVNLSRAWHAEFHAPVCPATLYSALRLANPAPFAALWQQADWSVLSSSPERLVSVRDGLVQTRPIAGTRPRGATENDAKRVAELVAHPKERAEHVMLIDLERNDLGRICVPGSVEVDEMMVVESYAHVHHLVSNVRGQLRAGTSPGEAIAATFPGGTITGCPKVRCLEIIAELEGVGRGAYTGSIGYLDRHGDLDLNILIRTLSQHGTRVSLRAGAGIVADSQAELELDETRAKARGMLRALGIDT